MAIGQIVGVVFYEAGPVEWILRIYVNLLSLLMVLNELEWWKFTRESRILRNWVTRGMIYGFIGVIGLEQNDNSTSRDDTNARGVDMGEIYIKAVAWIMIGSGFVYCLMGVACVQHVYNRQRADYEERMAQAPNVRRAIEESTGSSALSH